MSRLAALWLSVVALGTGAWFGTRTASFEWPGPMVIGSLSAAVFVIRRSPALAAGMGLLLVATFGYVTAAARTTEGRALEAAVQRTRGCDFTGRVLEQAGGLGTLVAVESAGCSDGPLPSGVVLWDEDPPPQTGARIQGHGWFTALGDDEFARARRQAGARALLIPSAVEREPPTGLWSAVARLRTRFHAAAAEALPPRDAALLLGLTIGDTSGFSSIDLDRFRAAGLTHVLAVSGSNVAMVLAAVAVATRRSAYGRRVGIMLGAAGAFVLVVGPDGSVLRAATMGSVALLAGGWVRPVDPLHSMPLALLLLLAVRPTMVTSAGLQLSAAATLGIVLWSRRVTDKLGLLPPPLAASLGVTLSAQFGVAPLIVFLFERISLVAPLTNVAAAPFVAVATIGGLAVAVLAFVSPSLAAPIGRLLRPALAALLQIAETGAAPGWAEAEVPATAGWILMGIVVAAAIGTCLRRPTA